MDETAIAIKEKGFEKVGILASKKSIESDLHKNVFDKFGIETVIPNKKDCQLVTDSIFEILKGNKNKVKKDLQKVIDKLIKQGAEAIILGCTDLVLVIEDNSEIEILDSLEILANATTREILSKKPHFFNKQ